MQSIDLRGVNSHLSDDDIQLLHDCIMSGDTETPLHDALSSLRDRIISNHVILNGHRRRALEGNHSPRILLAAATIIDMMFVNFINSVNATFAELEIDMPDTEVIFDLEGHLLKTNINEVANFIIRTVMFKVKKMAQSLGKVQGAELLNELIDHLLDNQYLFGDSFFEKDIQYLKEAKAFINQDKELSASGSFPEVFNGTNGDAFNLFKSFVLRYVIDHNDLNFIFQRMRKDKLINTHISHKFFIDWMSKLDFVRPALVQYFLEQGGFNNKSESAARLHTYLQLKQALFNPTSENSEKRF